MTTPLPAAHPPRPLSASYRSGVVNADMTGMPATCNVDIGGDNAGNDYDSGITWPCGYLDSYTPRAGDTVVLLGVPGAYVVLGNLNAGALRVIGYGTGPSASTDFGTGGGTAVTLTRDVVAGRNYRLSAYMIGNWITATGLWTAKVNAAGVEVARVSQDNHGPGVPAVGNWEGIYPAAATTSVAFTLTSQASSGANRVAANASWLMIEDLGVF